MHSGMASSLSLWLLMRHSLELEQSPSETLPVMLSAETLVSNGLGLSSIMSQVNTDSCPPSLGSPRSRGAEASVRVAMGTCLATSNMRHQAQHEGHTASSELKEASKHLSETASQKNEQSGQASNLGCDSLQGTFAMCMCMCECLCMYVCMWWGFSATVPHLNS